MARTLVGRLQLIVEAMGLGEAKKVESAITSIERSARRLSAAPWGQGFQRQIEKMALSAKELDQVRTSWSRLQKDMASRGLTAALKKSQISAWKTATLGHFASVRAGMRQTEAEARRLGKGIERALRPAYVMLGGYTGVYMTGVLGREAIAASADRQREYFRQRMADIPEDERNTIFQHSQELSKRYPSVNITDIMEMARTARNTMGTTERGMEVLDRMVQGFVTLQSANGVDAATTSLIGLMKGLDNLGTNADGEKGVRNVNNLIDAFIRASQIEGQDFDVRSIWEFAKRSRVAGPGLSPEFLATIAPAMIQDMGAGGAGTALAMAYKSFVIGANDVASKPNIAEQRRVGIRQGEGKGDLVDSDLFGTNPYQWVKKYLVPALQKDGVDIGNDTEVALAVAKLSRNSSATGMLTRMITQMPQYERLIALYNRGMGTEAAEDAKNQDPFVAWRGFQESLRNLSASVGETVMPVIVPALNTLASTINSFSEMVANGDPRVVWGAGIAGTAAAGFGTWKIASAIWGLATAGTSLNAAAVSLEAAAASLAAGGKVGATTTTAVETGALTAGTVMAQIKNAIRATGVMSIWSALVESLGDTPGDTFEEQVKNQAEYRKGLRRLFGLDDDGSKGSNSGPHPRSERDRGEVERERSLDGYLDSPAAPEKQTALPPPQSDFAVMLRGLTDAVDRATAANSGSAPEYEPPRTKGGVSDVAPMPHGPVPGDIRATPTLDTSEAIATADQAGSQIQKSLSVTAKPSVDLGALRQAVSLAERFVALMSQAAGAVSHASSNVEAQARRAHADFGVAP